jgi:hypothetical protein
MFISVFRINNQWCFMDANGFMNGVIEDGEWFPLFIVDYGVDISENKVGSGGGGAKNG